MVLHAGRATLLGHEEIMRSRRNFVPSCPQTLKLEDRVVLNGGGNQSATSVLLQGLNAPARAFRPHTAAAASSLVDLAFQSFQQDYGAVRATYLAAVQNGTAATGDMTAFQNYTQQRTNLLAQQVTNSLLLYTPGTTRGNRLDSPLPLIVLRINGAVDANGKSPRQMSGTLVMNLKNSTPSPGASPTTIALDTIAQDNAIEATRVATLNGVTIVRNGNFGNGNSHKQ
jgi:hypothetical protein